MNREELIEAVSREPYWIQPNLNLTPFATDKGSHGNIVFTFDKVFNFQNGGHCFYSFYLTRTILKVLL